LFFSYFYLVLTLCGNILAIPTLTDAAVTHRPAHLDLIICGRGKESISVSTIAILNVPSSIPISEFCSTA